MKLHMTKVRTWIVASVLLTTFSHLLSAATEEILFSEPSTRYIEERAETILAAMTLQEKIGQMTQVNKTAIDRNPHHIREYALGSLLSGGGEAPQPNTPENWKNMTTRYQRIALSTHISIPLIYGVDAVHGHGNVNGAVIFPHNIGLGATRDPELLKRIGRVTAKEVLATGIHWNFAPAVSVPQDIRWGRTYEGYSEDTGLVTRLSSSYLQGLQLPVPEAENAWVAGTVKHYVGDGATTWGSSHNEDYEIDQGNADISEEELREFHLRPYKEAVEVGARTVMVSYSSWQGHRMHSHRYLIEDVLKGELNFTGLVISDWLGVFLQDGTIEEKIARSINSGIDMVMAVYQYETFIETLTRLVRNGVVPESRINDAVRRILRVKLELNLFAQPYTPEELTNSVGAAAHRAVAREAVRKSAVLLKNDAALPMVTEGVSLLIAGEGANDPGLQSGGWTIKWQGVKGQHFPSTTLLEALEERLPAINRTHVADEHQPIPPATEGLYDYAIIVVSEQPYAEGKGDSNNLSLTAAQKNLIAKARSVSRKLILLIYSGRPLIITQQLEVADAVIAAWLPGSEGSGLVDLLTGDYPFTGKLPVTWPVSLAEYHGLPLAENQVLFPFGFGL